MEKIWQEFYAKGVPYSIDFDEATPARGTEANGKKASGPGRTDLSRKQCHLSRTERIGLSVRISLERAGSSKR